MINPVENPALYPHQSAIQEELLSDDEVAKSAIQMKKNNAKKVSGMESAANIPIPAIQTSSNRKRNNSE